MSASGTSGALCAARTARGFGCINPAGPSGLCVGHDPRNQCGQPTRTGGACKRLKSYGTQRCSKHQA